MLAERQGAAIEVVKDTELQCPSSPSSHPRATWRAAVRT
jgi:hypothetical protein